MEKEEIIYDLEDQKQSAEASQPDPADRPESADKSESVDNPEAADNAEHTDKPEATEVKEDIEPTPAETELQKMLKEVGADTLIQIIKDNRNAAIRQIINEVEAARDRTIHSGVSSAPGCTSIFDLASLA